MRIAEILQNAKSETQDSKLQVVAYSIFIKLNTDSKRSTHRIVKIREDYIDEYTSETIDSFWI